MRLCNYFPIHSMLTAIYHLKQSDLMQKLAVLSIED